MIFGLAVLAPFFHHHDEGGQADDHCPLCSYIAHHGDITLPDDQPELLLDCNLLVSWESGFAFLSTFHNQFLIRAPPAYPSFL
jgi:hypothetical protein